MEKRRRFIGEVDIDILRKWKCKMPVSAVEIDLDEIFKSLINNLAFLLLNLGKK